MGPAIFNLINRCFINGRSTGTLVRRDVKIMPQCKVNEKNLGHYFQDLYYKCRKSIT